MGNRRDANASTGPIRWPVGLNNTGEGGMFVTVVWVAMNDRQEDGSWAKDPFVIPSGPPHVNISLTEILVDHSATTHAVTGLCMTCAECVTVTTGDPVPIDDEMLAVAGPCPNGHVGVARSTLGFGQVPALEAEIFPDVVDSFRLDSARRARLAQSGTVDALNCDAYMSVDLLGAVTLGTSGGSWWDDERGEYWTCSAEDLTEQGRAIVDGLSQVYGRDPLFLTFLDT